MPSLIVGTSTAKNALRKEAEKVLRRAGEEADRLARREDYLARLGDWLDHSRDHYSWSFYHERWRTLIQKRDDSLAEIATLARTADYYADQLHDDMVSSAAVHVLVRQIAPPIGLFCSTSDLAYGEPDQYAPIGWRPKETTHEPE